MSRFRDSILVQMSAERESLRRQVRKLEMKISGLEKELSDWRAWDGCEHRCGTCDNGMTCGVHDCEENPLYSEDQFCADCGGCGNPQDDKHGGPCDPCGCTSDS